ncbi:expressed unknown protein [Seminavis robusta]|uniref:Uncharacterized protein n=1 Tax=Seminavis robusta TaxID=568900 RepID=A0A9N8D6H9_9STRA|nr:expressed unknown protein [Seminavis robusta]|eukprot:Sro17_g012380.1 n/a (248) ;mRNA; f:92903-93646
MQAYHPEANLFNRQALHDPYMKMRDGTERASAMDLMSVSTPRASTLGSCQQLDAWTLYELTKEKQKMNLASKTASGKGQPEVVGVTKQSKKKKTDKSNNKSTSLQYNNGESITTERRDAPERDNDLDRVGSRSHRRSVVLPLRLSHADREVDQMIANAKSKRNSLLSEVTLKLNEQSGLVVVASEPESLGDSLSSLPDFRWDDMKQSKGSKRKNRGSKRRSKASKKKGTVEFEFLKEDEDYHNSCFF